MRKLLGEEGVQEPLARTVEVAISLKPMASKELSRSIVDATVQEKQTKLYASPWHKAANGLR